MSTRTTIARPIMHSIRQRLFQFKETDAAYVDCFGDEAYSTESGRFGKITLWRIVGELAYTATKIRETLVKLIAEKRAVSPSRRPKGTSPFQEPIYLIQCFLIGVSRSHAAPYVTIVSSVEWFSNHLKDIILEGRILAAYPGWHCFRLPLEPQLTAQSRPQMSLLTNLDSLDPRKYDVYLPGRIVPTHINASRVEIWKDQSFVGHATIGGMVTVRGEDLALTVAHAFVTQHSPSPVTFEIGDSELDLVDCYDDKEDVDSRSSLEDPLLDADIPWSTAAVSPDITPSLAPGDLNDSSPSPPDFSEAKTLVGHLAYLSNIQSEGLESGKLDWALIEITDPRISKNNQPSPILCHGKTGPCNSDNAVTILTASASLDALVVSDGLFGIPGFNNLQPVRVANTGTVQKGDSGSWAIQRNTRKPLCMLVGSCPPLNESYLIGLEDLLQDIEVQTGLEATIASGDHPSQLEPNFSRSINVSTVPETSVLDEARQPARTAQTAVALFNPNSQGREDKPKHKAPAPGPDSSKSAATEADRLIIQRNIVVGGTEIMDGDLAADAPRTSKRRKTTVSDNITDKDLRVMRGDVGKEVASDFIKNFSDSSRPVRQPPEEAGGSRWQDDLITEQHTTDENMAASYIGSGSNGNGGRSTNEDENPNSITLITPPPAGLPVGLACLFYKLDPEKFKRCANCSFTTWGRVLQHLKRIHILKGDYCPICRLSFAGEDREALRDTHIHRDHCQPAGITQAGILIQEEYNRLRNIHGLSEEKKWIEGWDRLFPRLETPSAFSETHLGVIRLKEARPTILRYLELAQGYHDLPSLADKLVADLTRTPNPAARVVGSGVAPTAMDVDPAWSLNPSGQASQVSPGLMMLQPLAQPQQARLLPQQGYPPQQGFLMPETPFTVQQDLQGIGADFPFQDNLYEDDAYWGFSAATPRPDSGNQGSGGHR